MKHSQSGLRVLKHVVAKCIEILNALVFHNVRESLALHSGHVKNVGVSQHFRVKFRMLGVADAVSIAEIAIFFRHSQLIASHKPERWVEETHSHE